MQKKEKKELQFYLGDFGALMPFLIMLVTIILLVLSGNKSAKNYWTGSFVGIVVAYIFCKDKKGFNGVIMRAIQSDVFAPLFMSFLFSGIFAKSLSIGGLANGILWAAGKLGVGAAFFPLVLFLVGCGLSTATGTSSGTIAVMVPVFLPTAVALGCNPFVVMGAIIGGGYFGDNLAPISDTTIASACTQGIDVGSCVRTRLKYSLTAGITTIIILVIAGISSQGAPQMVDAVASSDPTSLVLIVAPILLVIMLLRGGELVPTLLISTVLSISLSLIFGLIRLEQVYAIDGIIATGTESMIGIMMFTLFTFCLINCTTESGVLDRMVAKISKNCKTPRSTELALIAICALIVFMVPSNSVAIVLAGPIAYKMIKAQNMEKTRGSNILDGICVSVSGLLPYGAGVLLAHSLSVSSGFLSEATSPFDLVRYNVYNMILIVVFIIAAITGWGRKFTDRTKDDEEISVDLQGDIA